MNRFHHRSQKDIDSNTMLYVQYTFDMSINTLWLWSTSTPNMRVWGEITLCKLLCSHAAITPLHCGQKVNICTQNLCGSRFEPWAEAAGETWGCCRHRQWFWPIETTSESHVNESEMCPQAELKVTVRLLPDDATPHMLHHPVMSGSASQLLGSSRSKFTQKWKQSAQL